MAKAMLLRLGAIIRVVLPSDIVVVVMQKIFVVWTGLDRGELDVSSDFLMIHVALLR
jgi:hypothetical protein